MQRLQCDQVRSRGRGVYVLTASNFNLSPQPSMLSQIQNPNENRTRASKLNPTVGFLEKKKIASRRTATMALLTNRNESLSHERELEEASSNYILWRRRWRSNVIKPHSTTYFNFTAEFSRRRRGAGAASFPRLMQKRVHLGSAPLSLSMQCYCSHKRT